MSIIDPADKYSSRPYGSDLYSNHAEEGHPIGPPGIGFRIIETGEARITESADFRIIE